MKFQRKIEYFNILSPCTPTLNFTSVSLYRLKAHSFVRSFVHKTIPWKRLYYNCFHIPGTCVKVIFSSEVPKLSVHQSCPLVQSSDGLVCVDTLEMLFFTHNTNVAFIKPGCLQAIVLYRYLCSLH